MSVVLAALPVLLAHGLIASSREGFRSPPAMSGVRQLARLPAWRVDHRLQPRTVDRCHSEPSQPPTADSRQPRASRARLPRRRQPATWHWPPTRRAAADPAGLRGLTDRGPRVGKPEQDRETGKSRAAIVYGERSYIAGGQPSRDRRQVATAEPVTKLPGIVDASPGSISALCVTNCPARCRWAWPTSSRSLRLERNRSANTSKAYLGDITLLLTLPDPAGERRPHRPDACAHCASWLADQQRGGASEPRSPGARRPPVPSPAGRSSTSRWLPTTASSWSARVRIARCRRCCRPTMPVPPSMRSTAITCSTCVIV